ncbi:flagellin [Acuticoccus sp. MNP-M23]|uniref:flagellin N-terminal helical domain-containing protein n=1 Tax=Acuticoccus sp. MNP-M23 TaxID=3072793 RepID=UPI0028154BC7|nr:flagellin [Acuticoccus sp. MNP-M23]WMS40844.1 flagellin [Acuticoccus sp. MNP-M23]
MNNSVGAMNALTALRSLNNDIETTTKRIATQMKIADASDGAAYWSIAQTARSEVGILGQVKTSLASGKGALDVGAAAAAGVRENLQTLRDVLVSGLTMGADRASLQEQVDGLISQMQTLANSADFNGTNLLSVDNAAASYSATYSTVAGVANNAGGTLTVSTIDLDVTVTAAMDATGDGFLDLSRTVGGTSSDVLTIDISALTDAAADITTLTETISIVDAAIEDAISAETAIGVAQSRIGSQGDFVQAVIDAKEAAIASLVEADLEEEAARLTALQTKQQLAVEALSVANANYTQVLALFR